MRIETDSLGEVEVPEHAYWGAQTQRSLKYFNIGDSTMPMPLIRAYAQLKQACALSNGELGKLSGDKIDAIVAATNDILSGELDDQFPLRVWQTGSGTQTNMNVNEVVSNRAIESMGGQRGSKAPVHPNDHVNMSQSSNDTFPTAMHVAAVTVLQEKLLPAVRELIAGLNDKVRTFEQFVKIGRTHLQDAVPITLGQEFSGYVAQLQLSVEAIEHSLQALCELALGGSAVGTGLNTHPEFAERAIGHLANMTGYPFMPSRNPFAALAGHEPMVLASGALQSLSSGLFKMANDIRYLGSGPRCGLGELQLPENEPGSSIMPGKVNPTQCEAMTMVCVQVHGLHSAIAFAATQGQFELNVFKPLIINNFIEMVVLLSDACHSFNAYLVKDLSVNEEKLEYYLQHSLMLVTALAPRLGYDVAAKIAKHAHIHHCSLLEAGVALDVLSEEDYREWVRPQEMLGPKE